MAKLQKMRKNSIYGPLRYAATRPFAQRIGSDFIAHADQGLEARAQYINKVLIPSIQSSIAKLGRAVGPGPAQAEITNIQTFGSFIKGSLIFDLSEQIDTLLSTDVSSVPLWAVPRIGDNFYLHFGRNDGLEHEDFSIEGVFVTWFHGQGEPPRLILDFLRKGQFSQPEFWLLEPGEPMMGCPVDVSKQDLTVKDALEKSVHEIVQRNKKVEKEIEEMIERMKATHGDVVISIPTEISALESRLPVLKRGLALVANSLLYLGVSREGRALPSVSEDSESRSAVFAATVEVC